MKQISNFLSFLKDRFPVEKMNMKDILTHKEVPLHKMSWAYYLGGLALFFFTIQLITGLLLLFYYQPTVTEAFDSVKYISEQVPGGKIIRNMHSWAASAMILTVILHLITTFAMKAFQKPREITWLSGIILLLVTFGFGFSGYLLPWHQIAVNATKVGLQTIGALSAYLPGSLDQIPNKLIEIIQGGSSIGQPTLTRFYTLHVVILPLTVIVILAIHLFSVQIHGMSKGIEKPVTKKEKFFPDFIIKDFSLWAIFFLILFVISISLPLDSFFAYPLLEPYDPLGSTPDGIKPEWYFFFAFYPMEMVPFWVILISMSFLLIVICGAPYFFRGTTMKTLRLLAILSFIYFVIMTIWGENIVHLVKGV